MNSILLVSCTLDKVLTRATFKTLTGRMWPAGGRFPTPAVDNTEHTNKSVVDAQYLREV